MASLCPIASSLSGKCSKMCACPGALAEDERIASRLLPVALLAGLVFVALGVARLFGWLGGDPLHVLLGAALFVAGYLACFVVPDLHRRLNALEQNAGRQLDAHERRLLGLEKWREARNEQPAAPERPRDAAQQ